MPRHRVRETRGVSQVGENPRSAESISPESAPIGRNDDRSDIGNKKTRQPCRDSPLGRPRGRRQTYSARPGRMPQTKPTPTGATPWRPRPAIGQAPMAPAGLPGCPMHALARPARPACTTPPALSPSSRSPRRRIPRCGARVFAPHGRRQGRRLACPRPCLRPALSTSLSAPPGYAARRRAFAAVPGASRARGLPRAFAELPPIR